MILFKSWEQKLEGIIEIHFKTARGVAETRLSIEKLPKGNNSGKNQSSMTSVKYDHLRVMETIIGKFHQNPLKNVGGVADTKTSVDKMAKTDKGP